MVAYWVDHSVLLFTAQPRFESVVYFRRRREIHRLTDSDSLNNDDEGETKERSPSGRGDNNRMAFPTGSSYSMEH